MLTLTNQQVLDGREGLLAIGDRAMNIKPAYRIAKMKEALKPLLAAIEAVRMQITDEFARRDAEGKPITSTRTDEQGRQLTMTELADHQAFQAKWDALMRETQQLDLEPVPLDWLEQSAGLVIEPDVLVNLGPLLAA